MNDLFAVEEFKAAEYLFAPSFDCIPPDDRVLLEIFLQRARRHDLCHEDDLLLLAIDPRVVVFHDMFMFYVLQEANFSLNAFSFTGRNTTQFDHIPGHFHSFQSIISSPTAFAQYSKEKN